MKKDEFLNKLRKKLEILEEAEVNDILTEYEGYIDEKMAGGSSEEEAVESFGSVDELAEELLRAYKVKIKKNDDPIGTFANKVLNVIDKLINDLSKMSPQEILRFILEIVLLIFCIFLYHIPVSMLV